MNVHGAPRYLRSDNGSEFVRKALLRWAVDGCLSMVWFRNRLEAKVIIEDWRRHDNEIRPHSSLNYRTPAQFVAGIQTGLSTEAKVLS